MLAGKEDLALQRVMAVKVQSDMEQPGTLFYLVHRVLDDGVNPGNKLFFYECYADEAAKEAHLNCSSWQALVAGWSDCFAGSLSDVTPVFLDRISGFVHVQAP